jgi:undecaprenyl-diphosphatase
MSLLHAIVLAVVQALTEFLPISSTAHLIVLPQLFHWDDPGQAFDVAMHAGTLLAVIFYFFRTWLTFVLCGLGMHYPSRAGADEVAHNRRMFWYMVVGTIPAGLLGLFFNRWIENNLRTMPIIGTSLIGVGLLMWWAETRPRLTRGLDSSNLGDALSIGTAQAIALWPGVSRSGITITAGLFRGMTREAATRFSFLLSAPIIAAAVVFESPKLLRAHRAGNLDLPLTTLLISIGVSAVVGYLVIAFFLRYLQTRTLKVFIVYRIAFGIIVLILALLQLGSAR